MQPLLEAWSLPFMQKALLAGILISALGGFFGPFVIQRRLSFLGNGLAHSALAGVAFGLLFSQSPMIYAVVYTLLVSLIVTWVKQRTNISSDTSIGIFFSLSVSLGLILLSLNENYTVDAFSYLFGSLLSIQALDIYFLVLFVILTLLFFPIWGRWIYATFDRQLAKTDLVAVNRDDYLLNAFLAIAVVISMKVLGIILLTAFFIIPAASARLLSSRFSQMILISILIALSSSVFGIGLSYLYDLPSGAVIVLCQGCLFLILVPLRTRLSKSLTL